MTRYIELCAGIGGMRAGLEKAGWECRYAVDVDADAAAIHRSAFGHCELGDVTQLDPSSVPHHEVLVSGFPCQPFSTSGDKKGFHHRSGNVFENVMRVVRYHRPRAIVLENVAGILTNRAGHSMACILDMLTQEGYYVEWLTTDTAWFGIPQTRPRVILVARHDGLAAGRVAPTSDSPWLCPGSYSYGDDSIFSSLLSAYGIRIEYIRSGRLSDVIHTRSPRIGMPKPQPATVFGGAGVALKGMFHTYRVLAQDVTPEPSLGEICCPNYSRRDSVRSVRYYARGGPTLPFVRKEPFAHCLGTNIGAAPTFAASLGIPETHRELDAVLEFANWKREQAGHQIFRLVPDRALLLFGEHVAQIRKALRESGMGVTKQYELIGNMVAPTVAAEVAACVVQGGRVQPAARSLRQVAAR